MVKDIKLTVLCKPEHFQVRGKCQSKILWIFFYYISLFKLCILRSPSQCIVPRWFHRCKGQFEMIRINLSLIPLLCYATSLRRVPWFCGWWFDSVIQKIEVMLHLFLMFQICMCITTKRSKFLSLWLEWKFWRMRDLDGIFCLHYASHNTSLLLQRQYCSFHEKRSWTTHDVYFDCVNASKNTSNQFTEVYVHQH